MISLQNISYFLKKKTILKNINAKIESGRFTSIVGPSGAGKSTLVRIVCGLVENNDGNILIGDSHLSSLSTKDLAKKISYVSQNFDDTTDFTVWDLMELSKYPFWEDSKMLSVDESFAANEYLRVLDIYDLKDRALSSLSGGERQRAHVASALFQGTPIVVLDEPTSSLDPGHQKTIMKVLKQEQGKGKTIIMVSHDINMALQMSDHIIALKHGELLFQGASDELLLDNKLDELYDVTFYKINDERLSLPLLFVKGDS